MGRYVNRYAFVDGELVEDSIDEAPDQVRTEFETTEDDEDEDTDSDDEDEDEGAHQCATVALDWVNSAYVMAHEDEDAVSVHISVGDPRGSFTMEIRRMHDGRMMLYTPYEGMGFSHLPIKKVNEGVYQIGHE